MIRRTVFSVTLAFLTATLAQSAAAQATGRAGIRLGAGADISGGVAFGGQIDYTLFRGANSVELGLLGFGGSFEEETDSGVNTYREDTDVIVIGAIANYLFRHAMESGGPYFVAGVGAGGVNVQWREESPTDTSLGSPLLGGGSFQEEEGTVGGLVLNFGIGHRFTEQVDLRAQVPTFFIAGGEQRESQVVPTLTVTLGIGF